MSAHIRNGIADDCTNEYYCVYCYEQHRRWLSCVCVCPLRGQPHRFPARRARKQLYIHQRGAQIVFMQATTHFVFFSVFSLRFPQSRHTTQSKQWNRVFAISVSLFLGLSSLPPTPPRLPLSPSLSFSLTLVLSPFNRSHLFLTPPPLRLPFFFSCFSFSSATMISNRIEFIVK